MARIPCTPFLLRSVVFALGFIVVVFIAFQLPELKMDHKLKTMSKYISSLAATPEPATNKCGLLKPCPFGHLAFKMTSGAANVIGPRICLDDKLLMSTVMNNVGRGINIALIDGRTGGTIRRKHFDMFSGDVAHLIEFLKKIEDGTVVMMASFDEPSVKLNDEARKLIADMGSSYIHELGPRDSWVFVGAKSLKDKSPFEQHLKNDPVNNKFDGWPEVVGMEGCLPQRED
ncbi:protein FAM3C-like [Mugil cephalus]|uniref:protein FAM3C-like n=1 Tax=Mugil cephalus TaxID=48193 RepID=UPI001FB663DC|nr:protein FAM3C-like [Mugil cephalus]